jgi:hypothetical protein
MGWGGARPNSGPKLKPAKALANIAKFMKSAELIYGKKKAFHPLEFGYREMLNEANPLGLRLRVMKTLLPYFAPRQLSVDITSQEDRTLTVRYESFPRPPELDASPLTLGASVDLHNDMKVDEPSTLGTVGGLGYDVDLKALQIAKQDTIGDPADIDPDELIIKDDEDKQADPNLYPQQHWRSNGSRGNSNGKY